MAYTPYYPATYGGYPSAGFPARPEMAQGFPAAAPQPMQQPPQPQQPAQQIVQGLSPASRPVTNREEANAVSADFSGSLMVFPDITHNRVYIKRWNFAAGAADFLEYAPVVPEQDRREGQQQAMAFAPLDGFLEMKDTIEQLKAEIERLKRPAGKAVKKNDPEE